MFQNENFQFSKCVVCENCSKLEINSLHNLKARVKYYVLTQYVSGQASQVSNDCTSIATNERRFYTKNTFSQISLGC